MFARNQVHWLRILASYALAVAFFQFQWESVTIGLGVEHGDQEVQGVERGEMDRGSIEYHAYEITKGYRFAHCLSTVLVLILDVWAW